MHMLSRDCFAGKRVHGLSFFGEVEVAMGSHSLCFLREHLLRSETCTTNLRERLRKTLVFRAR